MLSEKMEKALNAQVNAELFSAYLYVSMAAYFESVNLGGMATWMRMQAKEEDTHAMKIFDFINDRGGRVTLTAIDAPETEWDSALAVFEAGYAHEQKVTGLINDLVKVAREENDPATEAFLQWFVSEQVEEEKTADGIVQALKMVQSNPPALLMMDRELGQRQPPAEPAAEAD